MLVRLLQITVGQNFKRKNTFFSRRNRDAYLTKIRNTHKEKNNNMKTVIIEGFKKNKMFHPQPTTCHLILKLEIALFFFLSKRIRSYSNL